MEENKGTTARTRKRQPSPKVALKRAERIKFGKRLREARLATNLSTTDLCNEVGISRQTIYKYEDGTMKPKLPLMKKLADALKVSVDYLNGDSVEINQRVLKQSVGGFRNDSDFDVIEAKIGCWVDRCLQLEEELCMKLTFENPIRGYTIDSPESAERAALDLRDAWGLGRGPIANLLTTLELNGVRVMTVEPPFGSMIMSTWANKHYPVIVVDPSRKSQTTESLRFLTLTHLCHLLVRIPAGANQYSLSNQFASHFLLPREAFHKYIGTPSTTLTHTDARYLIKYFGIPIEPLIQHAYRTGIISQEEIRKWRNEVFNKDGVDKEWAEYKYEESADRYARLCRLMDGD